MHLMSAKCTIRFTFYSKKGQKILFFTFFEDVKKVAVQHFG